MTIQEFPGFMSNQNTENLLVNLAIVKLNSDKNSGILDNYIPVFAYCLKQIKGEYVNSSEAKEEFFRVTNIDMPMAVVVSLIKRSSKRYGYLEHTKNRAYRILKEKLPANEYEEGRDSELRKFNKLKAEFITYCKDQLNVGLTVDEAEAGFFDALYMFAPKLYRSVIKSDVKVDDGDERVKFLTAKFIKHCAEYDDEALSTIESFVRGAMLTEVFYYSDPDRVDVALGNIKVYFDTGFLIRALGFCDPGLICLSKELIDILSSMGTKMRCFRDTLNEIDGILYAAEIARKRGSLQPKKPGDVFDYYNNKGSSASDIRLDRSKIERRLRELGVQIEDRPIHTRELGINEQALSAKLDQYLQQSVEARKHDIDCVSAIHRLRKGRAQNYLESCEAIFVTTNASLARGVTEFFKDEHGRSDISACMADQVFTTLVWMKAVKKRPLQPSKMIVANCIAALQPSKEIWEEYLGEITKLEAEGDITTQDYYLLVHSTEARSILMDSVIHHEDAVFGSAKDILERIKDNIRGSLSNENKRQAGEIERLDRNLGKVKEVIRIFMRVILGALVAGLSLYLWISANKYANYGDALKLKFNKGSLCALFLAVLAVVYILTSFPVFRFVMHFSDRVSEKINNRLFN